MFYVNHVGAQTEIIFDGGSIIMSPDGNIYDELPYFKECMRVYDLSKVQKGWQHREQNKNKITLFHDAFVTVIKDYFGNLGL